MRPEDLPRASYVPSDPAFFKHPYPAYADLHDLRDPFFWEANRHAAYKKNKRYTLSIDCAKSLGSGAQSDSLLWVVGNLDQDSAIPLDENLGFLSRNSAVSQCRVKREPTVVV